MSSYYPHLETPIKADLHNRRKPSVVAQLVTLLVILSALTASIATYGAYCEHRGWKAGFQVARAVYSGEGR